MQRGTKVVIVLVVTATLFTVVTFAVWDSMRSAYHRQYLVLRATDVLWTDAPNGTVPADLGPQCPDAQWAFSGALIVNVPPLPTNTTGILYVQYTTNRTFNGTNQGGVAVFFFTGTDPFLDVASVANRGATLFTLEDRNSTMFVGGTEYAASQTFTGSYVTPVTVGSDTWRVWESYTVESLGVTTVTVQPPPTCP